jgi:hypothetical protein
LGTCDAQDKQLLRVVEQLVAEKKIIIGGIHERRYVLWKHRAHWMVPTLPDSESSMPDATQLTPIRSWYDIYGARDEVLFSKCLRCVVQAIMQKPGIQEVRNGQRRRWQCRPLTHMSLKATTASTTSISISLY